MMCITRSAFDSRLWQTSYGGANLYALVGFPLLTTGANGLNTATESVISATLWYYVRSAGTDMYLHEMGVYWTERSNFDSFPLPFNSPTVFGRRVGVAPGTLGWHRLDVTGTVRSWTNGTRTNRGFIFQSAGSTGYTTIRGRGDLRSGLNCCPPTYAPRLEIVITPARTTPQNRPPPPPPSITTVHPPGGPRPSPPPPMTVSPPSPPSPPPSPPTPPPPPLGAGREVRINTCQSTFIRQGFPYTDFGYPVSGNAMHSWDGASMGGRDVALIQFDSNSIFANLGQREAISSATLNYKVAVAGADAAWHEATVPWTVPGTTWHSFVGTTGLDDEIGPVVGSVDYTQSNVRLDRPGTWHSVNVLSSVLRWQSGAAANHGWAKVPNGEHGGSFYGCDYGLPSTDQTPYLRLWIHDIPAGSPIPQRAVSPPPIPAHHLRPPPPPARPLQEVIISGDSVTEDTYISSAAGSTASNYHQEGNLRWDGVISSSSGGAYYALMKFNLTAATHMGPYLHSARLNYHVLTSRPGPPAEMHELTVPWASATVTHDSLPFATTSWGPSINEAPALTSSCDICGWNSVDVTESVRRWMANPSSNHGWIFVPTGSSEVDVDDSASPINAPALIIQMGDSLPPSPPPSVATTLSPPSSTSDDDASDDDASDDDASDDDSSTTVNEVVSAQTVNEADNTGAIVGGVVGGLGGLALIIIAIGVVYNISKRTKAKASMGTSVPVEMQMQYPAVDGNKI